MPRTLTQVIADAVTRIAQKACRNGESGDRVWPPLAELPLKESWEMLGRQYAPEILAEIAKLFLETHMNMERDIEIQRALWVQQVPSSLHLRGPLGDAIREEARPHLEALVKQGVMSPEIWKLYEKP